MKNPCLMGPKRFLGLPVLLLLSTLPVAILALPRPALCAWDENGKPITTATGEQTRPLIVSDGSGGGIVIWMDRRSGASTYAIYMNHVNPFQTFFRFDGDPDSPIFTGGGNASPPRSIPDSEGGAFVAWSDDRNGSGNDDIFVQRVHRQGGFWPSYVWDGNPVCTAPRSQTDPTLCTDDAGGAFFAWTDARKDSISGADIYVQRFLDYGAPSGGWPFNGRALCAAPGDQREPAFVADGSGGAIAVWRDFRNGTTGDLFAGRVLSDGSVPPTWQPNGNPVCVAAGTQDHVVALEDGAGGAYFAWRDTRSGVGSEIYVARIIGSGDAAPGWDVDGDRISLAGAAVFSPAACSDGSGGIYLSWLGATPAGSVALYAQHLLGDHTIAGGWPTDGRVVAPSASPSGGLALMADGSGGAIVAWNESSHDTADVRTLRLNAGGMVVSPWNPDGALLTSAPNAQLLPTWVSGGSPGGAIVTDGWGGAIVAWTDGRAGVETDIYAQRVAKNGDVAPRDPPCSFECSEPWLIKTYPNPARTSASVEAWTPGGSGAVLFNIYDIHGRLRRTMHLTGFISPGYNVFSLDLADLPSGVYFFEYQLTGSYGPYSAGHGRIVLVH